MTDTAETQTLDRISVTLTPKARQALNYVAEVSEETKTDVVIKALRLYEEYVQADRSGRGVYIRTAGTLTEDGELERVRFL